MSITEGPSDQIQQAITQLADRKARLEEDARKYEEGARERMDWRSPSNTMTRQTSILKKLTDVGIGGYNGLFEKIASGLSKHYPGVIYRISNPSENPDNKIKLQALWGVHEDPKDRRILEADNSVSCVVEDTFGHPAKVKFYRGGQLSPINLSDEIHGHDDSRTLDAEDLVEFAGKAIVKALAMDVLDAHELVDFRPRRGPLGAIDRRNHRYRDPNNPATQTFAEKRFPPPRN